MHEYTSGLFQARRIMDDEPDRVPSVGCLLYLVADQLVPRRVSWRMLKWTKVPCKPVRVHPIRLSALVLAAPFMQLREKGIIDLRVEVTKHRDPTYKANPYRKNPGRFDSHTTMVMTVLDPTPQPGLTGRLLTMGGNSPESKIGILETRHGKRHSRVIDVGMLSHGVAYPFVRNAVLAELLELGYCAKSHGVLIRPDCRRIAAIEGASANAVRWWERMQATERDLCAMLLDICQHASIPEKNMIDFSE
jgi:hypothetical protein